MTHHLCGARCLLLTTQTPWQPFSKEDYNKQRQRHRMKETSRNFQKLRETSWRSRGRKKKTTKVQAE